VIDLRDQDERALRERLALLREEPPADDAFRAALRQRLSEEGPPSSSVPWHGRARDALGSWRGLAWPLGGALAGAATFALMALVSSPTTEHSLVAAPSVPPSAAPLLAKPGDNLPVAPQPPTPSLASGEVAPRYVVPASKVAVIQLTFNASIAVEGAAFAVTLPEGLSFWSEGERLAERAASWQGDLDAGDNVVPIAVRAERPGQYRIKTRVDVDDEKLEHEIILEAQGEGPS